MIKLCNTWLKPGGIPSAKVYNLNRIDFEAVGKKNPYTALTALTKKYCTHEKYSLHTYKYVLIHLIIHVQELFFIYFKDMEIFTSGTASQ